MATTLTETADIGVPTAPKTQYPWKWKDIVGKL